MARRSRFVQPRGKQRARVKPLHIPNRSAGRAAYLAFLLLPAPAYDEANDLLAWAENIWAYRLKSQSQFAGEYPVGNWAGADPGTEFVGLADGMYLILAPLPVGKHKIECYCEYGDQFADYGVVSGPVKTVYHITVKRAGKH